MWDFSESFLTKLLWLLLTRGLSPRVFLFLDGNEDFGTSLGGTYDVIPWDEPIIIAFSLFYRGLADPPLLGISYDLFWEFNDYF